MKVYVLCSYGEYFNDPLISTNYHELYEKMKKSFDTILEDVEQTEEEKEFTYFSGYSARAVIYGDWMDWSITEHDLVLPPSTISEK